MAQKTTYVVLEEGQQVNYANPPVTTQQTIYTTSAGSTKKKVAGSACCCLVLLLFFLLFFLIPRDPEVIIKTVTLTPNLSSVTQPLKLSTNFDFVNRNFYKMQYSDLDITVCVWESDDTCQIVGHGYYNSTAIDLGIRGNAPIDVNIEPVATYSLGNLAVNNLVQVQGSVAAETNGAVHKNFGRVNIVPENIIVTN